MYVPKDEELRVEIIQLHYDVPVAGVMKCFRHWQFFFSFLLFLWFYINFAFFSLFDFLLDDEEAHDTAVTWNVTWCDIIGLEHGRRI